MPRCFLGLTRLTKAPPVSGADVEEACSMFSLHSCSTILRSSILLFLSRMRSSISVVSIPSRSSRGGSADWRGAALDGEDD